MEVFQTQARSWASNPPPQKSGWQPESSWDLQLILHSKTPDFGELAGSRTNSSAMALFHQKRDGNLPTLRFAVSKKLRKPSIPCEWWFGAKRRTHATRNSHYYFASSGTVARHGSPGDPRQIEPGRGCLPVWATPTSVEGPGEMHICAGAVVFWF
jgi:hypothetical protein